MPFEKFLQAELKRLRFQLLKPVIRRVPQLLAPVSRLDVAYRDRIGQMLHWHDEIARVLGVTGEGNSLLGVHLVKLCSGITLTQ